MSGIEKIFSRKIEKFEDTISGVTFVASDTKRLVRAAAGGDIKEYCRNLQQYKLKFSRDYSIVLLILSPIIVAVSALLIYAEQHKKIPFDKFHKKIYGLTYRIFKEDKSSFEKLCEFIGKGEGKNIAEILEEKLIPYRKLLMLFSGNKYGKKGDALMKRIGDIRPWVINKKYIQNKLIPFVKNALGTEFSSKIKNGLSSAEPAIVNITAPSDKRPIISEPDSVEVPGDDSFDKKLPKVSKKDVPDVPISEHKDGGQDKKSSVLSEPPIALPLDAEKDKKSKTPEMDRKVIPEETKKHIARINETLKRKRKLLSEHKKADGTPCKSTYEELQVLLRGDGEGEEDISSWVDENYPEWRDRMRRGAICQEQGRLGGYENYALMNLAHSLRLAKAEGYDAASPENNELVVGKVPIDETKLETIEDEAAQREEVNKRLDKIIVEDEDILRSAQKHFDDLQLMYTKFGILNAGDPYDPNGFLPNRGRALEEYLSMNTTLCRDLSHRRFRRAGGTAADAFYTTREEHAFPPVVDFPERIGLGRYVYDKKGAWDRLTGPGRDFYHERGVMSKNVYLTRSLGDCSADYLEDRSFTWVEHETRFDDFEVDRTKGLGSKPFCILSIAGLEDRSNSLLRFGDDEGHTAQEYQEKWKEITMKQCEFVLRAFIKEQVKVLFLCAFGAGCFGGWASIVAACFRELLIRRGFINFFDKVVFPIGYDDANCKEFKKAFKKL